MLSLQAATTTSQKRCYQPLLEEMDTCIQEVNSPGHGMGSENLHHSLDTSCWTSSLFYSAILPLSKYHETIKGQIKNSWSTALELRRIGIFKGVPLPPATGLLDSFSFSRQRDRRAMSETQEAWVRG